MGVRVRSSWVCRSLLVGATVVQAVASATGHRRVKLLSRPLLMLSLAGHVLATTPSRARPGVRLLVAGLALSAVGDTVLAAGGTRAFAVGLAAFLGTHLCYIAGCPRVGPAARRPLLPWLPAVYAAGWLALSWLLRPRLGPMGWPVIGYGLVLFAMGLVATGAGPAVTVGAVCFMVSDIANGLERAGILFPTQSLLIGGSYLVGQSLIAAGWTAAATAAAAPHRDTPPPPAPAAVPAGWRDWVHRVRAAGSGLVCRMTSSATARVRAT